MKKAELFWKPGERRKEVVTVPYDDKEDYCSFIRSCCDFGFRPTIVTTETMTTLIQMIISARFRVSEIVMSEDEDELAEQISNLLDRFENEPALLSHLISLLDFVIEGSAMGVQRVGFRRRTENGAAVEGFIQSNGLMGANTEVSDRVFEAVATVVGRCMFEC